MTPHVRNREIRSGRCSNKNSSLEEARGKEAQREIARKKGVETAGNRHSKGAARNCRTRKSPSFHESRPAFTHCPDFPFPIGLERGRIEGFR
ncbi:unnamed protein product [Cuscuta europaea]|uniref:Uncharacterized protein n=1 Tax=Cuscuta europaea TaxID=41803 RepID=A0A9P0YTN0_CUSEU|nr:unnamed protein product [Cuscuta europaea]